MPIIMGFLVVFLLFVPPSLLRFIRLAFTCHRLLQRLLSYSCVFRISKGWIVVKTTAFASKVESVQFRLVIEDLRGKHDLACLPLDEKVRKRSTEEGTIQV